MNAAHWLMLGIVVVLVVVFVPRAVSEVPAVNQELLEMQAVYYAAHVANKAIQLESECGGVKVWSYGWLNDGEECAFDFQCHSMIDDGVSYQIAERSFCCLVGLAAGTCVEDYEKWTKIVGG